MIGRLPDMVSRFAGLVLLAIFSVAFEVPKAAGQEDGWQPVAPGVEFRRSEHEIAGVEAPATLAVVRADPTRTKVVVLDSYSTVSREGKKYASYSLRELKRIVGAIAVVNGGFGQSFALPVPAGLVVQDGDTISPLNRQSRTQSGVFCVNGDEAKLVNKLDYRDGACRQALQSGPKIVEYPGENGISRPRKAFIRSVACIDDAGRVLLVRSSSAALFHVAEILRAETADGGYGCEAALNLSGDVESGMLYEADGEDRPVGEVDSLVASAIAILPRSAP
ncbi:MAG: phosphodiester glycosidase family protein [Kiloniellales bacterium]|nr:phosphodiester glycosidase family protein [Kiloniellales bacterium]